MNVSYKGIKQELPPRIQRRLDAKFAKLSKLLERRGEKEAHVIVTSERHLHRAEITIQFYDHQLVAIGSDNDLFAAMSDALEKLEKQALKQRTRFREKHRRKEGPVKAEVARRETTPAARDGQETRRVFRVDHHERRKPITLDEALLEMEGRDYLVYRDADKGRTAVLVRRRDGHIDLIES
jgi:putative sigma-54 modulation protein